MCLFYPVGSQLDWIEKTGTFKYPVFFKSCKNFRLVQALRGEQVDKRGWMKEMQRDKVANCTTSVLKAKVYFDVYPVVCVRKKGERHGIGNFGEGRR
jgi:hypothetical protein